MPSVSRQRATQAPQPQPTAPAAPTPNSTEAMALKAYVYGISKTGKTRLAATFPKPILFIGQDGTKSIATGKKEKRKLPSGNPLWGLTLGNKMLPIDLVRLFVTNHFEEALSIILAGGYKTVCLDVIRDLLDLHTKDVLQMDTIPVVRAYGMANQATWGSINQLTIDHLFKFFDFNEKYGISVVVLAHERNFKDESGGVMSELIRPNVGADCTPGVKKFLDQTCDYICQTYIGAEEKVVEVDPGTGVKVQQRQPTGNYEYRLRIGKHPVYTTGFRTVADSLPEYIVNPTYEKICRAIVGQAE